MPRVKKKEFLTSFEKFLINKGKEEASKQVVINGNKTGLSNEFLSKITKLSIKKIEKILS